MKSRIWIFFVVLAGLCWGVYVPLVAEGGKELHSAFAAFLCVGAAYFLLAVLLPVLILGVRGKKLAWNGRGVSLSTLAGVTGAVGALCVIFATFVFGGPPMFVAPVVFALAPVINTLVSLFWHPDEGAFTVGAPREPVHWSLYLGVVLAGLGAALVLAAKDLPGILAGTKTIAINDYTFVIFVLLAGLSWGVYVPLIAQGGKDLKNSYASFLCVGAAYFVIAVVLPLAMLWYQSGQPKFHAAELRRGRRHPRHALRRGRGHRGAVRHLRHLRVQGAAPLRRPGDLRPGAGHQHHRHSLLAPDAGRADDVRAAGRAAALVALSSASCWPAWAPAWSCSPRS